MAAPVIRIDSADDPRVAAFRDIRERDLTGRQGRFVAEGTVVLRMLAAHHGGRQGFRAESILLLENRVAGVEDILAAFPDDVPVHVVSQAVMDGIAGFHMHRGVLALGQRIPPRDLAAEIEALPERALAVVAAGISNHDNMGSIFRNAAAFGVSLVVLDETACDPLYRKALRVSVGSVLSVPYARGGSTAECLERLQERGFAVWGLSPAGSAEISKVEISARMALVLGTEGEGLPEAILGRFRTARIAQNPGLDSLNVATASGIALYQIATRGGFIDG
ncbi:TrmH family RNA methyltransferase [Gellertiella hungarica]|uniref:tRNA G18 (Ribose-2'-O)-methylase SpoU n=1 Tax=Gellertiella hungarica TaxID=1572859 RepID=A0A7W6J1T0_9HYPH|nr:RNA methyltransferase [Gellertiella hungarica]MBB4063195.1 tRNA G18 (ribose-2'-O)-methylase SpoU [Gellertiella hungarica]